MRIIRYILSNNDIITVLNYNCKRFSIYFEKNFQLFCVLVGELGFVGCECLCELVAAGGWFAAAGDAFDAVDDGVDVHAFDECADGGEVAGAAAHEGYVGEFVVLDVEGDAFGAYAARGEAVHCDDLFSFGCIIYDSRWWIFCNGFGGFCGAGGRISCLTCANIVRIGLDYG